MRSGAVTPVAATATATALARSGAPHAAGGAVDRRHVGGGRLFVPLGQCGPTSCPGSSWSLPLMLFRPVQSRVWAGGTVAPTTCGHACSVAAMDCQLGGEGGPFSDAFSTPRRVLAGWLPGIFQIPTRMTSKRLCFPSSSCACVGGSEWRWIVSRPRAPLWPWCQMKCEHLEERRRFSVRGSVFSVFSFRDCRGAARPWTSAWIVFQCGIDMWPTSWPLLFVPPSRQIV